MALYSGKEGVVVCLSCFSKFGYFFYSQTIEGTGRGHRNLRITNIEWKYLPLHLAFAKYNEDHN